MPDDESEQSSLSDLLDKPAAPPPQPSVSLSAKLQDLEQRLAADAPTPAVRKAPAAKKAPAKKAPPAATVPAAKKAPAKKAPATKKAPAAAKAPAKQAPAKAPAPQVVTFDPSPPPAAEPVVPSPRPLPPPEPEPVPVAAERAPGIRAVLVVIVLLLAVAAGLGAAAVVEAGPSTWESTAVVELLPGDAPSQNLTDALANGVARYTAKVHTAAFTQQCAGAAGLTAAQVREQITATPAGTGKLRLHARAATGDEADALADWAAPTLVQTVAVDQVDAAATQGDRLSARNLGRTSTSVEVKPQDSHAWLAGGLAAGLVLLLGLVRLLIAARRKTTN